VTLENEQSDIEIDYQTGRRTKRNQVMHKITIISERFSAAGRKTVRKYTKGVKVKMFRF
jgi:hypothetical protein